MTLLARVCGTVVVASALTPVSAGQSPAVAKGTPDAIARYCQVGGIGLQPPDAQERFFATAVIEVRSPAPVVDPKVRSFDLVDATGGVRSKMRQVTEILEFTRPRTDREGIAAYYGNTSGNRPWDGTLPAGIIRLQVHVSFDRPPSYRPKESILDLRCRIAFGSHLIERHVDAEWPT